LLLASTKREIAMLFSNTSILQSHAHSKTHETCILSSK